MLILLADDLVTLASIEVSCYNEFECINDTIVANSSVSNIDCYGGGSCAGGLINNIGNESSGITDCLGSRSCQSLSIFKGTVEWSTLSGYLALAWTSVADDN